MPVIASAQGAVGAGYDSVAARLKTPAVATGGYVRYNLPRRDLTVTVGDVRIAPALALGGWVGFDGPASDAMLMGDLVLTAGEIAAVERELVAGGIAISAVHNHLVGESPTITYLHVHGHGNATALARTIDAALSRTAIVRPVATAAAEPLTADTAVFFGTMGVRGRAAGSVASVSVDLVSGPVMLAGMTLKAPLSYAAPVNMQFVNAQRALTTGDFAVTEAQLAPLVNALVNGGLTVSALHSHLVGESPRIIFVHFWGDGNPGELAAALLRAVDAARAAR